MDYLQRLQRLLLADPLRMEALYTVQALQLRDGWIGAGFVRDAVWDHLHGYGQKTIYSDVDVVWFDPQHNSPGADTDLEAQLNQRATGLNWSVKNQAWMHQRNGHRPYLSTENALRYWPETATAVAVRAVSPTAIEVIAPYGLTDLFELRLRPTAQFEYEKRAMFNQRLAAKRWTERYPLLQVIAPVNKPD